MFCPEVQADEREYWEERVKGEVSELFYKHHCLRAKMILEPVCKFVVGSYIT